MPEFDFATRTVQHLDPQDIALFRLYRLQNVATDGRSRDDLPYTKEFNELLAQYNEHMRAKFTRRDLWLALRELLKPIGEGPIEDYLSSQGIEYPGKGRRKRTRA